MPRPEVPDRWIEVEARHAAAVHDAGLPTPMVLDVLDVDGRPSIVFERVDGPSMLDVLAGSPDRAAGLAREMAAIQSVFHAAAAPPELPDQGERVAGKIASARSVCAADREEAARLLGGLPTGRAVCHGDVHPGNILLGEQGPMVIDWFDATSGPPLSDVVRSSLLLRPLRSPAAAPPHLPGVAVDALDRFHDVYVTAMLGRTDVDVDEVLTWEAALAVSRLSEPLDVEVPDLVAVWEARSDPSRAGSPLSGLVLRPRSEQ